ETKKDAGAFHSNDASTPPSAASKAAPIDSATTAAGRADSRVAAAAGVTTNVKIRSTPVTWIVSATAAPSMIGNTTLRVRTGTPRASAAAASTEANHSGRHTM